MQGDRVSFTPNRAGIRELLNSAPVQAATVEAAKRVERAARAIAPVDTGKYRRSFASHPMRVPTLTGRGGMEIRAGAIVENTAPHAAAVEGRTHTLARAAKGIRY